MFPALAAELFALQFKHNPFYRRICEAAGVRPQTLRRWEDIPAVPTAAFKEMEVTCLPAARRTHVFHSSGTTGQRPSRHFHSAESLAVYEASAWAWFARRVLTDLGAQVAALRLALLTPPPAGAPHSSLVHMLEVIRRCLGESEEAFLGRADAGGAWELDGERTFARLQSACEEGVAVAVLGTAFSFVHLLDRLAERELRLALPPGSLVMETGGYKGRSRSLPKAELHALIGERLGVPASRIVCEYGMSELSSQAYDTPSGAAFPATGGPADDRPHAGRVFRFPPWARARVVSPETGREVGDGETGLIQVFDLANVFSVMAIQTQDLGVRRGDGFELLGRAAPAEPRGCSLLAAEV